MRFQNQGLKTSSFAVTHGRTPIVASMMLIFPCVRLDCVSSASKTCLDYVWSVNVFMLSVWAILPAQVSLPSLVEVVSLLHTWIRSPTKPLNEDHVDLVCVSVQIWRFWGPDLGHILVPVSGSIFGHRFGPLQLQTKSRGPKNGTQNKDQNWTQIRPQNAIRGPKFVRRRKQGRVEMIVIQRSAGRSYSSVQQTNNFNQRRKGNLAGKIAQTESMNTFTDQT